MGAQKKRGVHGKVVLPEEEARLGDVGKKRMRLLRGKGKGKTAFVRHEKRDQRDGEEVVTMVSRKRSEREGDRLGRERGTT